VCRFVAPYFVIRKGKEMPDRLPAVVEIQLYALNTKCLAISSYPHSL
jgi:hypothetical protein